MIHPMERQARVPSVRAVCDECGKDEVLTCDYEQQSSHVRVPNYGQANRKITGQGWEIVKGKHYCPACRAKRKARPEGEGKWMRMLRERREREANVPDDWDPFADDDEPFCKEPPAMAVKSPAIVTPLREPTREQKRQIMSLLEVSYDTEASRYKGSDTDKTVAEAIGGGCMPGWVAELREEFFGPDGGNAAVEDALTKLAEMQVRADKAEAKAAAALGDAASAQKEAIGIRAEIAVMTKTLSAIKVAFGPKAERA